MRVLICFIGLFALTLSSKAQQISVFEQGSKFPIENVSIYNDSRTAVVYTNKKGQADLKAFDDNDILVFDHLSFNEFMIIKKELGLVEFVIYLSKKSEQLEEVVLSASKNLEKESRIAEQFAIASAEEIKKLAPQSSVDLLTNLPGVKVQKSQFGGGSPVLRGMEANRILLVIDGVRMNNAIYRMGHLQNSITVSPNIIERTEVIFGPSSVIYGSDALGGVIHFITKTPKVSFKNEIYSSIFSRFSSVNNEFTTEGNVEIRTKKWASYTSVSNSNFGDLKMGKNRRHGFENWGKVFEYSNNSGTNYSENPMPNEKSFIQKNTGYSQFDFLQKFALPLPNNSGLVFNLQYSKSTNINRFDKLTEYSDSELKFAEWHYGPQKRFLFSTQLKISPDKNWLKKGTITAAYQKIEESRIQRKFSSLDRSYRDESLNVFSLNGDFFIPLSKKNQRVLSYGFEVTHNDVDSKAKGKTLEILNDKVVGFSDTFRVQSRYPDGGSSYTSSAIYTNYRQDLSNKTTLNTGIRCVNTNLSAKWHDDTFIKLPDSDISINNSAVTATLGLIYKPNVDLQLNSVVSSGFRSPNIDDIGKVREKSGNVTVPNTDLKPEFAYNFETGVLKYFSDRTFRAGFNFYYTLLSNYIARDYFMLNGSSEIMYDGEEGNVVANINKDAAHIVGSTFSIKGNLSSYWFTKGSITYTSGRSHDTNQPLSSIPPIFGMAELSYDNDRFQANLNWRFNGKKKLNDYNLIEGIDNIEQTPFDSETNSYLGTPSWNTFNLNANYKFSNHFSLFINLDNILDTHYKEFASSISAAGRNVSLTILVKV